MKKQYRNTVKNYYVQNDGQTKHYFVVVDGNSIEVSEEIFKAYAHYGNKERYFDDQYDKKYYVRMENCPHYLHELIVEASEEIAIRQLDIQKLQEAIRKLNMHQKKLIWLLYVEGYTLREAASILGITDNAVFKQNKVFKTKLKKLLMEGGQNGFSTGNR